MKRAPTEKPKAYQLTYEELAPDMKRFAGVWVVPEGADDPFEAECAEIIRRAREEEAAEEAARSQRKDVRHALLRKAVAA